MRIVIAGSRHIIGVAAKDAVIDAVTASGWRAEITEVVSGGARGIDEAGEWWAKLVGLPSRRFPADWGKHGRAAGPIRNTEMAKYADRLIAIPHATVESRGTHDMIHAMRLQGGEVFVFPWPVATA